jgi:aarF domain-containing kinase
VAQSLSARPDIIGTETAKVLAELQDRLPPFPSDEAVAIIEEEFGCSLRNIFAYLSMEPVAAASFGQVYRGCTIDGLEVAVKVQRPDLLFSVARDVYILRIGVHSFTFISDVLH